MTYVGPRPWLRGLIFDLDGTLIDSSISILTIINGMRAERGAGPLSMSQLTPHLSKGGLSLVAEGLGDARQSAQVDLREFRTRYARLRHGPEILYGGVREVLPALRSHGWRLGLCTNKPRGLTQNALEQTGLAEIFDAVVTGDEGHPNKPHPASLEACSRQIGLTNDEVIFIGDSEADRGAAAAARVAFIYVTYGYPVGEADGRGAHARCDGFADFPRVLLDVLDRAESNTLMAAS